jgi:hypothetical protein
LVTRVTNAGKTKEGAEFIVRKELPTVRDNNLRFNSFLNKFRTSSLLDRFTSSDRDVETMNDKISTHTFAYMNKIKATTGDDISKFLNKTLQNTYNIGGANTTVRSTQDLFNTDSNNFGAFFFERYKNINNQYEDLRIITEFLFELNEAVTTMRDNIIGADDMVSMISRELKFKDAIDTGNDEHRNATSSIERVEKDYQLKEKLKNIIIPGVLTYGNFFVYTIPYKDVFAQFNHNRKLDVANGYIKESATTESYFIHPVLENAYPNQDVKFQATTKVQIKPSPVVESITEKFNEIYTGEGSTVKKQTPQQIAEDFKDILENIEICDRDIPLMESSDLSVFANTNLRDEALKAYRKVSKPDNRAPFQKGGAMTSDSVIDTSQEVDKDDVNEYKDIPGIFMKLYEPERIIPVYVMDSCIGYYVLYETFGEVRNSILLNSSLNRTNIAFAQVKKKELDDEVINVIADSICQSIDKKYVAANPQFKELMVNAISYQDFYKKKFKVQFISVSYMTHFKVNDDPNTHMGTSVLKKSLFYAKLYLSMLIFKIITILTKSNDMRVYYIKNAGIDKNMVNRVQEIARAVKDNQISFNDLASIQTIFSKVGKFKDAFIPMGKSGEKNIEFEIVSGQQVELNNDFMELLRKGMINNTGIPSVILSYMEEADFAKTITMQHSKYMARIISLQTELEKCVTEMYTKILAFEGSVKDDVLNNFEFIFTRPKTLNSQDMSDLLSSAQNIGEFLSKNLVDENDQPLMAATQRHLIRNLLLNGVFNWKDLEEEVKKVKLDMKTEAKEKELAGTGQEQM